MKAAATLRVPLAAEALIMSETIHKNAPNQTLTQLKNLGLIDDTVIDTSDNAEQSAPWFISIFFGFSGILASLFLIGFLTLLLNKSDILESFIGLFVTGIILSAIGAFLFYNAHIRLSSFWNSLAFAITLAGQGYITFAILFEGFEQPFSVVLLLCVQLVMTTLIPNFVYRLLSATAALCCLVYLCSYYHIAEISLGLLALIAIVSNLQRYSLLRHLPDEWQPAFLAMISAVAYASAFVLLSVSIYFIAAEYGHYFGRYNEAFSYNYSLAQELLTLASLYAAFIILKRYSLKTPFTLGLLTVIAIAVLSMMSIYVSGLLAASLIIVIAVANSQRVLLAFGIIALVSYIFWYYYQLDTSLLLKSASMLIIGMGLLLIRLLLVKYYFADRTALTTADDKERLL